MLNSLAQVLLEATASGVPDFFQGTELFELTLVDPDNRPTVDYGRRAAALAELRERAEVGDPLGRPRELVERRRDGRIKLYVTHLALTHRRANEALFAEGAYVPLQAEGPWAEHVAAFARPRGRTPAWSRSRA